MEEQNAIRGLWSILGTTYILKASVANQVAQNPTMTITNPVGTGPFMLGSYSSSLIKWKPNPYYWGGTPPESEIDTPAISTNAAASDALVSGQLDWAGNDIPNVYANYVNLNPQTNHAWFASGNTVVLWFNLNPGNGGATGISEAAVRKAISYGVDRNALALLGESGYEQPAYSSSALVLPNQKVFLPPDGSLSSDLAASGSVPDAATAKADKLPSGADVYDILTGAGWTAPASSHYDGSAGTFKSGGNCDGGNAANCWTKGGHIIKFSIYDPVPFSDYWENASLMSQELQALGMDVTTKPAQGYSDWNTTLTSNPAGWQTAIHWGQGGSIPYIQYQDWLDGSSSTSAAHYEGAQHLRQHRSQQHLRALPGRAAAGGHHGQRRSPGAAPLRRRLERVQQRQVHRMAHSVAPVHEPLAQRPADAVHPDAAQGRLLTGGDGRRRQPTTDRERHEGPRRGGPRGQPQPGAEGPAADGSRRLVAPRRGRSRLALDDALRRTGGCARSGLRPSQPLLFTALPGGARRHLG